MGVPMKLRLAFLLLGALSVPGFAADPAPPATVLQNTVRQDGLLPVHVDSRGGRILLSLPAPDAAGISGRFIYVAALESGLGSASIGLDRALSSGSRPPLFPPGRGRDVAGGEKSPLPPPRRFGAGSRGGPPPL